MNWIEFFKPNDKCAFRLFCFHYSGAGASTFYPWVSKLPEDVELGAIQLPGRETRFDESLLTNMEEVISGLVEDFKSYLEKPFLLFGHSLGALISFELVRALKNLDLQSPMHLIVSGCRAPDLPSQRRHVHNLSDNDLVTSLLMYNGISKKIIVENPGFLELFLPIVRADFTIFETYDYLEKSPLNCDITAIGGKNDPLVSDDDIKRWRYQTSQNFRHLPVPGDHLFIKSNPGYVIDIVNEIIGNLKSSLNKRTTF